MIQKFTLLSDQTLFINQMMLIMLALMKDSLETQRESTLLIQLLIKLELMQTILTVFKLEEPHSMPKMIRIDEFAQLLGFKFR